MKGLRCISDCSWDNHYYGFIFLWEFLGVFYFHFLLLHRYLFYFLKLGRTSLIKHGGFAKDMYCIMIPKRAEASGHCLLPLIMKN